CKAPTSATVLVVIHNHTPFAPRITYSTFCYPASLPMALLHQEFVTVKVCPIQNDATLMYISPACFHNKCLSVLPHLRLKTLQKPLSPSKPIFLVHANPVWYVLALYTYRFLYPPCLMYLQNHHPTTPNTSPA